MGVATDGDVALCHRFAGSDAHKLGTVRDGIDREAQQAFLEKHHLANKTDCSTCWARPLCSGGCYHEAHTRYGDTTQPNLHYCEWIRGWTDRLPARSTASWRSAIRRSWRSSIRRSGRAVADDSDPSGRAGELT